MLLGALRDLWDKTGMPAVIRKASGCEYARGRLIAAVLAGSWRKVPPRLQVSPSDLSTVVTPLVRSGAGALMWWRLKHSPVPLPRQQWNCLENIHRAYTLKSAVREYELGGIVGFCEKNQIDPILIKGWAIAKLYADRTLRPMGDVDLYVLPERVDELSARWSASPTVDCAVDWDHTEITKFGNPDFHTLCDRAILETVAGFQVRIPCLEDHLRILCIHALKHGAWRPLWMCDIAAALESRSQNFDWNRCLGPDRKQAKWIISTLSLAGSLLQADVQDTPAAEPSKVPKWLTDAVLRHWESCESPVLPSFRSEIRNSDGSFESLLKIAKSRWPNPIQATVDFNGTFSSSRRWPFQLRHYAGRAWKALGDITSYARGAGPLNFN